MLDLVKGWKGVAVVPLRLSDYRKLLDRALGARATPEGVLTISQSLRDQLLVEARHRCTICAEKCYEIHHIVEQSEGGSDEYANLIVLCPNCHQHRHHRHNEFTKPQLRKYKERLLEEREIEKRLLQNLEEIRQKIETQPLVDLERELQNELATASALVRHEKSPTLYMSVHALSEALVERNQVVGGARRAIEIEWELRRAHDRAMYPQLAIVESVPDETVKADAFPAAYEWVFRLSEAPSQEWRAVFEHSYRNSFYPMKRRYKIRGDRLAIVAADSDDAQSHANWLKKLVAQTNSTITMRIYSEIDAAIDAGKAQALKQLDGIHSLKRKIGDIQL